MLLSPIHEVLSLIHKVLSPIHKVLSPIHEVLSPIHHLKISGRNDASHWFDAERTGRVWLKTEAGRDITLIGKPTAIRLSRGKEFSSIQSLHVKKAHSTTDHYQLNTKICLCPHGLR